MGLLNKIVRIVSGGGNSNKPKRTALEKLIDNGLTVGSNFHMLSGCMIDFSHCWHITIGDNVTLAPRVIILAHDASTKMHFDYAKVKNVTIGNRVFIGAGSIIMPGVTIGSNVIVGAGSVVTKDIAENSVVAGNPAKLITTTDSYIQNQRNLMTKENTFDHSYTLSENLTDEMKSQMIRAIAKEGTAFVV